MTIVIIVLIIVALIVLAVVVARSGIFGADKGIKDGMRFEAQGRYHDALAAYDKVMQKANVTPELRWKIANICLKLNLISRAQKELNILASTKNYPSGVNLAQIKAALASASIAAGNEREAFYELAEVLQMNNHIPTAYRDMGYIYCHQAQTKKGISYLEKYVLSAPNDQEALYTLGIAYLDAGNAGKAMAYLEKALRVKSPETADIEYYLGLIYLGNKKFGQAQQHLTHAISSKKIAKEMTADIYRMLAICCKEKGLIDEAIINYGKSIEMSKNNARDPRNKTAMYNQAVLYVQKNNLKKAEECLTQIQMIDPGFKDTRIALEAVRARIANKPTAYIFKFAETSIINSVLMKGLLYSRNRFDIESFEVEVQKQLNRKAPNGANNNGGGHNKAAASHISVSDINSMNVANFKEIAKKIIMATGYAIESDVRFPGDHDYIDGNAVNYMVKPSDGSSKGGSKVFSIRRFDSEVDQMAVGTFIDWIEEKGLHNAIFVATNSFDKSAVPLIQKTPNIKFVDQNGLAKVLVRIK